jgi:dihydroflavonol-4-reductase
MKVLVTGSNGLLGHHVVMELLKRQHAVSIIVRSGKNIYFDLNSVEVFIGNFSDYESLKKAAAGCDAIIHIAAVTATNLLKYENYSSINVEGSTTVINVANELKINRIVYVSSANTVGFGNEQQLANERFNIEFPFTKSHYALSKVASEKLFVEASTQPEKHIVIINPTFMIGAFDTKPSSGKLMLMGFNKRLMIAPKGGKNFVPVNNVAVAICNALTLGINGERYLVSGVNLSFKEFYSLQKQIGNYSQKIIEIPDLILILMGKIGDLFRQSGIKSELCSMNIRQLIIREYYTNLKAKSELNLPETDLKIAIKEAIDWFKNHKML